MDILLKYTLLSDVYCSKGTKMSKLQKIIWSKIDLLRVIGIYSLLLIVNAFSQSRYVDVVESNTSHEE